MNIPEPVYRVHLLWTIFKGEEQHRWFFWPRDQTPHWRLPV